MPYEEESKNARRHAIRYLVYRNRSRDEIIRHLKKKKISESAVDKTIIFLESNDYINDERFAIQFGRSRILKKKIGKLRLELELKNKGLKNQIIKETLKALYEEYDEKKIALSCTKKKIASNSLTNGEKDRHRIAKYLERKGFSYNIIYEVITNLDQLIPNNSLDSLSRLPNKSPDTPESTKIKIIQR
jgi:regulatory protein